MIKKIKKHISDKQWLDFIKPNGKFNGKNIDALRKVLGLSDGQKLSPLLLDIGTMIEILENHFERDELVNVEWIYTEDEGYVIQVMTKKTHEMGCIYCMDFPTHKHILYDALWESIMKVLEED